MKWSPASLALAVLVACWPNAVLAQDGPPLPAGLGSPPAAPPAAPSQGPPLPAGLGEAPGAPGQAPPQAPPPGLPFDVRGFSEVRAGARTQEDPHERSLSLSETRVQLGLEKLWDTGAANLTADLVYDPLVSRQDPDLEEGRGWCDVREASLLLRPMGFMDVKVGRQALTWGTGDLLFLNDLFPKDWVSFLSGRDVEYLKAPSDALKVSLFSPLANLDVVYTPCFDADRFITGRRLSFYNGALGRLSGRDAILRTDRPEDWFTDDEVACRLYRTVGGYELAAYGYGGYWKSPAGLDPATGRATFPELNVYGLSARGTAGPGIGNAEVAYYDSAEDRSGRDPFVPNSQVRLLLGYEQEVARDLTAGVQYYLELMCDHPEFLRSLPPGAPAADEARQVLTLRLTQLLMQQNLRLGLFAFYSPSDGDAYLRPLVHYRIDDHWSAEVGANVFIARTQHTFFGQFENDSNLYLAVRYGL